MCVCVCVCVGCVLIFFYNTQEMDPAMIDAINAIKLEGQNFR